MTGPRPSVLREASAFLRFGMSGVPGLILAFGLNAFLIEKAHWPKPLAYLLVVWMQMTLGFLMCHYVVFDSDRKPKFWIGYGHFALNMGIIRLADWGLYTTLVRTTRLKYLYAQLVCTAIFFCVKFIRAKNIFRLNSA